MDFKKIFIAIFLVGISITMNAQKNYYLALPPDDSEGIPLIVGETSTIYGNTLANVELDSVYTYVYTCDIGATVGDNFVVTPSSGDIGTHQFIVDIRKDAVTVAKDTTILSVHNKINIGTKSIAAWGNSLMYNNYDNEMDTITSIFNGMTLNTIGIYTLGAYKHNAISGYHYARFVTNAASNLTFSGGFHVDSFFIQNTLTAPDYVYVRLGVNDINNQTPDGMTTAELETIMQYLEVFVDSFLAFDPDLKFIIGLPSYTGSSKAKWDADYDATAYEDRHDIFIENAKRFHDTLIYTYRHPLYDERVYLDYASLYLDRTEYVDAIHTNDAGSSMLGRGFANTLNAIMVAEYDGNYHVATNGNNSNPGTLSEPWLTIQYGLDQLVAGDTLYIHGGVYDITSSIEVDGSENGTAGSPICVFNYPGETPIIDGDGLYQISATWIHDTEWWKFRGITIRNVWQDGKTDDVRAWNIARADNTYWENCVAYNVGGPGFTTVDNGAGAGGVYYFTNCDSYDNYDGDSDNPGNDADGWTITGQYSNGDTLTWPLVYFDGCRAWGNSDDGYDQTYGAYVNFNNCWAVNNGWEGDGNGIKGGLYPPGLAPDTMIVLTNNLAAYNKQGFRINSNSGDNFPDITFYNNTAAFNSVANFNGNFHAPQTGGQATFQNNVAYGKLLQIGWAVPCNFSLEPGMVYTSDHNTWDVEMGFTSGGNSTLTDTHFASIDSTGLTGPRQADGSLPDLDFMRLAAGSSLIDAGVDVGLPFQGTAPSLGYDDAVAPYPPIPPGLGYKLTGGDGKILTDGNGKTIIGR